MADAKLENISKDSDKFRCPICLEEVRNPKYLPCYHTFCKSCIQTYISSTAACSGDNSPKTIQCPVCRKSIQAPSDDASSEEWACSLPEDKLILCMSVDSDQNENKYCMFCQRNDKTVVAKHWCKTCTETICDDCKSFHSYVPMLQGHKIVRLSDVEDLRKETEIDEPCLIHKGKYVEVFCHDHDQLCCSTCFFTKHRFCKKVESMEDATIELEESYGQITPTCFIDVLKKLDQIQEEYRKTVINLNAKKQEICTNTDTKVEEIKSLLDKAHNQWMKQFEQKHSDAVGNIEIASDEVKRFATAVQEAKTMMQMVLENGSQKKQLFVSRYKVRRQILDHVDRLHNLKILDAVHDYNQPDTDFLRQVCDDQSFQDVSVFEMCTETLTTVSNFAAQLQNNQILNRRKIMSKKDWMKIGFEKLSESDVKLKVYYGLFVDDTNVLLSVQSPPSLKIYDITDPKAKCVLTYACSTTPFGICLSGEGMDKVYVSFKTHVDYYKVEISQSVTIKKIKTIELKTHMKGLSGGPALFFTRNDAMRMICTPEFSVKSSSQASCRGNAPFISASSNSYKHAVVDGNELLVVGKNNEELFKKDLSTTICPRGLAFDLQENIFVCVMNNKLMQIKYGGGESRYIELPGIKESYNVVLHPTGEKVLILDFGEKFCVYRVL